MIYGQRHILHDEDEAAAVSRPLNPGSTQVSLLGLAAFLEQQQPQGTAARGRSLQALWVNERSILLSNQQLLEERPLSP